MGEWGGTYALASSVGWSRASGRGAKARGAPSPLYPEMAPEGRKAQKSVSCSTECFIPGGPRQGGPAGLLGTNAAGRWLSGAMLPIAPCDLGVCKQALWVDL